MNVSKMLTGYAFGTIKPPITVPPDTAKESKTCSDAARMALDAGRAKRSAMAAARRDEIPALVRAGKTAKEIAAHYGLELMTIRNEIADAAKAGTITKEEAKSALPPIIHQRDRVYKKAHAASIDLRGRMLKFVTTEPKSMNELSEKFGLTRATIMSHIAALELDGKVRRINGYPYKIAAKEGQEKKA